MKINSKKAITLIELIVGVTISMLLMVSLGVFLSSGLKNLFLQEKSIGNRLEINDFYNETFKTIGSYSSNLEILENGIIFKRNTEYNNGAISYIGTENFDYCKVGTNKQKKVFIKNFIPSENENTGDFSLNQKENSIYKNGEKIIGTNFYGKEFKNGELGINVALNGPSSLIEVGDNLFFSDTLNNRILRYNKTEKKVYNFLNKEDGISLPTGLYNNLGAIIIANSGNGEILEYKNIETTKNPKENIVFDKNIFYDFNKITITYSKLINLNQKDSSKINAKFNDEININGNIFKKDGEIEKKEINLEGKIKQINSLNYKIDGELKDFYNFTIGLKVNEDISENLEQNNSKLNELKKFLSENKEDKALNKYNEIEDYIYKKINLEITNIEDNFKTKIGEIEDFKILGYFLAETKENFTGYKENDFNELEEQSYENSKNIFYIKIKYKKQNEDGDLLDFEENYKLDNFETKDFEFNFTGFNEINSIGTSKGSFLGQIDLKKEENIIFKTEKKELFKNDKVSFKKISTSALNFPYKINGINSYLDFDLKNPGSFISFDETYDKSLDLPVKSIDFDKSSNGILTIIIKYYRSFDCDNLDSNEEKINTILIKKKLN